MGSHRIVAVCCALLGVALVATPAQAAFPGQNGKITYTGPGNPDGTVWTINPDGTGNAQLGPGHSSSFSPDGTKIAFVGRDGCCISKITVMDADGSNPAFWPTQGAIVRYTSWSPAQSEVAYADYGFVGDPQESFYAIRVTAAMGVRTIVPQTGDWTTDYVTTPSWSPLGDRIAFEKVGDLWTVRPDGSDQQQITSGGDGDLEPNWSPDGTRFTFVRNTAGNLDVYSLNADGTGITRLTDDPAEDRTPAWSPDGHKIAFASKRDGNYEIYTMNADGTNETRITNDPAAQYSPSWQPLPVPYPRPKGATPVRVTLVPAYPLCSSPNRTHGPPLAFGSCSPPTHESSSITVGTADANGAPSNMEGYVRYDTIVGDPTTPADEADLGLRVQITDVRCRAGTTACGSANAADGTDYTGEVEAQANTRMTDHEGAITATAQDVRFPLTTQCSPTADPNIGSTCSLTTTLDTLIPGAVVEKARTILQLGQVRVVDGGPDGDTATEPNTVFLRQGIFVP